MERERAKEREREGEGMNIGNVCVSEFTPV